MAILLAIYVVSMMICIAASSYGVEYEIFLAKERE